MHMRQTFLAMPLFDFNEASNQLKAKPGFWVYWAITIPLTLIVLAMYLIYLVRISRKDRLEDRWAMRQTDSEVEIEKMTRAVRTHKGTYEEPMSYRREDLSGLMVDD